MTVGKALTGGYLTLAATLCTAEVAEGVSGGRSGGLMHGPTFMGNPLACAIALASLDLLAKATCRRERGPVRPGWPPAWRRRASSTPVADVRVLGAVGVVQLREPVDVAEVTAAALDAASGCARSATSSTRCRRTSPASDDRRPSCAALVGAVARCTDDLA